MPTVTFTSSVDNNNNDGSQNWTQRNTAYPTNLKSETVAGALGSHYSTDYVRTYWFIFRFGDGTSGSGIAQGATLTRVKLNFSTNNGTSVANSTNRLYITVENNLDPTGTGAITDGTAGTMPWRRLGRQANAVTEFGVRCGPTHSGTLSTTGVGVTNTSAYIYKAFADGRSLTGFSYNLTDDFTGALQALVNDSSWNGDSQYVLVNMFADPNATAGTDGVGRLDGITWASGQTGSSTGYTNGGGQMVFRDSSSGAYKAQLIVDVDTPITNASPTTTAPTMGMTVPTPDVFAYNFVDDVSYHDSIGDSTNRVLDIYTPTTTAPSGGFPVVFFVHGGGFNSGSEADVKVMKFIKDTLNSGFIIVSIRYKLTIGDLFWNSNTGWTNPSEVQDCICALKWIKTNKTTYSMNTDKLVGVGYSAGSHILLHAALLLEDSAPDSYQAVYRGYSTTLGTRYPNYPALDYTQGRTSVPHLKAFFSLAGPVNIYSNYDAVISLFQAPFRLYYGQKPNDAKPTVSGEWNLDDYMLGTSGSIYAGRTPQAPSFPVGWTYAYGDTTVPYATGYTAMYNALNTLGYDVSQAATNGNVATGVALSAHGYTDSYYPNGGHDGMMLAYSSTFYTTWLAQVLSQMVPSGTTSATDFFQFF